MAIPIRMDDGIGHPVPGHTRSAVRELLLRRGALTAGEIGRALGLTAAAVRRHLDALLDLGAVEAVRRPSSGARGRPARAFQLTAQGRRAADHHYDLLARDAIAELRRLGGTEAVAAFARRRVREVIGHIRPAEGPHDVARAVDEIAEALSDAGYAASVERAGTGMQICQHHCPVWNVASRFPELCAAEEEVVAEIVGSHVQRLATIAGGDCACTTNIPVPTIPVDSVLASVPTTSPDPADADASVGTAERTTR